MTAPYSEFNGAAIEEITSFSMVGCMTGFASLRQGLSLIHI
jgi:hypothetical protein